MQEPTFREFPRKVILDNLKENNYIKNHNGIKKKEKFNKLIILIITGSLSLAFFVFVLNMMSQIG